MATVGQIASMGMVPPGNWWEVEWLFALAFLGAVVLVEVFSPTSGSITPRVPDGPVETFYDNGQLKEKVIYKDGKLDGPRKTYNEDGQLRTEETYKDGKLGGPSVVYTYYDNGQLREKRTYKDRLIDGPFERYDRTGELFSKGTYKNGWKCGEWFKKGKTVTHYRYPCRGTEAPIPGPPVEQAQQEASHPGTVLIPLAVYAGVMLLVLVGLPPLALLLVAAAAGAMCAWPVGKAREV